MNRFEQLKREVIESELNSCWNGGLGLTEKEQTNYAAKLTILKAIYTPRLFVAAWMYATNLFDWDMDDAMLQIKEMADEEDYQAVRQLYKAHGVEDD
jgi:hypothetical protein